MRAALLGDIHGNASALSAVLEGVRREQATHLFVTGDFIGYYYQSDVVLRCLAEWPMYAVRGNHEDMLRASRSDSAYATLYRMRYGSGIDVALAKLSEEDMDRLCELPKRLELNLSGKSLLLGHGAPWDTNYYIYPDASDDIWERLANYGHDYIVLGHTHHQFSKRIGRTLVINPGSVGQPRDRKRGAAWALLDTQKDEVVFFNEHYDLKSLLEDVIRRDPHLPYLVDVLVRK
jgi:putative phosphoesterase